MSILLKPKILFLVFFYNFISIKPFCSDEPKNKKQYIKVDFNTNNISFEENLYKFINSNNDNNFLILNNDFKNKDEEKKKKEEIQKLLNGLIHIFFRFYKDNIPSMKYKIEDIPIEKINNESENIPSDLYIYYDNENVLLSYNEFSLKKYYEENKLVNNGKKLEIECYNIAPLVRIDINKNSNLQNIINDKKIKPVFFILKMNPNNGINDLKFDIKFYYLKENNTPITN